MLFVEGELPTKRVTGHFFGIFSNVSFVYETSSRFKHQDNDKLL